MTIRLHYYTFLKFSLFILIVFGYAFSTDNTVMSSTDSLTFSNNKTIASPGDIFELGFFNPDSNYWYLGIWFKKPSIRIYVWVANRDNPLTNPVGTIRVQDSKLVLFDQYDAIVWSTNNTEENKGSPTVIEFRANGNLVLRYTNISESDEFLWQSFDFPTDTLLQGMKLGWELRTGRNIFLRSWKNRTDPKIGNYSYGMDDSIQNYGFPSMFIWFNGHKLNRISPWNAVSASNVPRNQSMMYFSVWSTVTTEEVTFSFQISNSKYTSAIRLNVQGYVEHILWNETSSLWDTLWISPKEECDIYRSCGPNSYCDIPYMCYCMKGFEPKNQEAWTLQNRGDGCVRKSSLSCSGFEFFQLSNIKLPDTTKAVVDWETEFDECKKRCVTNCTCTAFTTVKESWRTGCVIWTGDLVDVRQYEADGHNLFVKQKKKKPPAKLLIGLSVFALGCIISVVLFCYWRRNIKRARVSLALEASTGHLSGEDIVNDLELPLISFQIISHATDIFSVSNKLGEGGFGIVYKGRLLDNKEIAVKRLSMISGQGVNEFKNELMLITKIQHVNLVRLFGYCINGNEKLLIYEFLENRSLDIYLFDETQSCKLNWPKRFEIIVGVARGLSYLHEDSAVKIIHRDLKRSNVLLDKDMTPKISDFGMARIFGKGENEVNTKLVVGTHGYMSPEYSQEGKYSVKSDVFSFGVLILEILSGKRNKGFAEANNGLSLLSYAWKKWTEGEWRCLIDPIVDLSSEDVKRCFQIGLLCVQDRPDDRPIMSWVVVMLVSKIETIPQPHPPGYFVDDSGFDPTCFLGQKMYNIQRKIMMSLS